jgi:hypothetical protein
MERQPPEGGDSPAEQGPEAESPRVQRFQFGPWVFNVNRAQAIIAESTREVVQLPVAPWAQFYGLDNPDGTSVSLFSPLPEFNRDYAMTTDLSDPLLVAMLRNNDGEVFPLLIDGTHRLYRGHVEHVATLPAHALTEGESLAVREDAYYR